VGGDVRRRIGLEKTRTRWKKDEGKLGGEKKRKRRKWAEKCIL
jgi:hypothetical protein